MSMSDSGLTSTDLATMRVRLAQAEIKIEKQIALKQRLESRLPKNPHLNSDVKFQHRLAQVTASIEQDQHDAYLLRIQIRAKEILQDEHE